jgi:hypothetical protein
MSHFFPVLSPTPPLFPFPESFLPSAPPLPLTAVEYKLERCNLLGCPSVEMPRFGDSKARRRAGPLKTPDVDVQICGSWMDEISRCSGKSVFQTVPTLGFLRTLF